jgi:NadR type nicotinamide-nucleotide adenylyltransferase
MTYNHGLILGKFYPPHLGHLHLITEGKKTCRHLTVIISSLQKELIPGKLRFEWLKQLIKDPDVEVVWIQDENPQYPEEHPDFWQIWKISIEQVLKNPIDVLYTSEHYGDPLANVLGTKHVSVDVPRNTFNVSATNIRTNPMEYWNFIPEIIRPYFLKRIVLTGSESVGKSTLSKILAERFNTVLVPEFARDYLDAKGRYVIEGDIQEIGIGHLKLERENEKLANRILFLDTDHLTTKIYSEYYFESCPDWIKERAYGLYYDHSLFLDIDVPWVADPQRDLGENREEMRNIFMREMEIANRNFTLITGDFNHREKEAVKTVEAILKLPMNPCYFTEKQKHLRNV